MNRMKKLGRVLIENLFEILFFTGLGFLFYGVSIVFGCGWAFLTDGAVLVFISVIMIILEALLKRKRG